MFELIVLYGIVLGVVELAIGAWAFKEASETGLNWMKAFAIGVIIMGLGQIFCKVLIQGLLGQSIGMGSRVGTLFSFIGLLLVLYSILEAVDHPRKKLALQIALILGAYYSFGAMLVLGGLGGPTVEGLQKSLGPLTIPLFFYIPHILSQTLVPFGVAYLLYDVYKETGDKTALMIAAGIAIYGTAAIAVVSHLAFSNVHSTSAALRKGTMLIPLAYDVAVKIAGLAIILQALRQIAKAYSQQ